MKTARIETPGVAEPEKPVSLELERMYKPEAGGRAQMIEGAAEEVVGKLVGILAERGIL